MLIVNPRDDAAFVDLVEQLVADEATTIADLQAALRGHYPQAVVHLREISAERVVVWYVYRDGRWIGPGGFGTRVGQCQISTMIFTRRRTPSGMTPPASKLSRRRNRRSTRTTPGWSN